MLGTQPFSISGPCDASPAYISYIAFVPLLDSRLKIAGIPGVPGCPFRRPGFRDFHLRVSPELNYACQDSAGAHAEPSCIYQDLSGLCDMSSRKFRDMFKSCLPSSGCSVTIWKTLSLWRHKTSHLLYLTKSTQVRSSLPQLPKTCASTDKIFSSDSRSSSSSSVLLTSRFKLYRSARRRTNNANTTSPRAENVSDSMKWNIAVMTRQSASGSLLKSTSLLCPSFQPALPNMCSKYSEEVIKIRLSKYMGGPSAR